MINKQSYSYPVIFGGHLLAFIAGGLNLIALISISHSSVTHVTGNLSHLVHGILLNDSAFSIRMGIAIVSFLFGSILSGFITAGGTFRTERKYGVILILESFLIALAGFALVNDFPETGEALAATASGLQNGMVSLVSRSIVRTTHMTGVITDIGTNIGFYLRNGKLSLNQLILHCALISGFLIGGFAAGYLYSYMGLSVIFVISAIVFTGGILYFYANLRYPQSLNYFIQFSSPVVKK